MGPYGSSWRSFLALRYLRAQGKSRRGKKREKVNRGPSDPANRSDPLPAPFWPDDARISPKKVSQKRKKRGEMGGGKRIDKGRGPLSNE